MELIDKDTLLAEIEKRMQELHPTDTHKMQTGERMSTEVLMWLNALTWVKKAINSLETKDVDLEKEIELVKGNYEQVDVAWNNDFDWIARHFYELGLKAQKGE